MDGRKVSKNQMTRLITMLTNMSFMKYALKLVSGLADVGVPNRVLDGPRTSARCPEDLEKFSDD